MSMKSWALGQKYWAKRNPLFWWNLGLLAVTINLLTLAVCFGSSFQWLKYWGACLQLLGVYTVWRDLDQRIRDKGNGSYWRNTWKWLKEFNIKARVHGDTFVYEGSGGLVAGGAAVTGMGRALNPNAPLPDRVAVLEDLVDKLEVRLGNVSKKSDQDVEEIKRKVAALKHASNKAVKELRDDLDQAVVGNATMLAFGALWLAVGVILASVPDEIWGLLR